MKMSAQASVVYETRDLQEAAFIACLIGPPYRANRIADGPVFFGWQDREAVECGRRYWRGDKVSAMQYANWLKRLKRYLFDMGIRTPLRRSDGTRIDPSGPGADQ